VGHVARVIDVRNTYKILPWKSEGRRPLGRPRRGWEDNTRMDLREVSLVRYGLDPSGSGK
jgi:hypothetical protein